MLVQRAAELVIPTLPNRQGVGVRGNLPVHRLDFRENDCELEAGARSFDGEVDLFVELGGHFGSVVDFGHGFFVQMV